MPGERTLSSGGRMAAKGYFLVKVSVMHVGQPADRAAFDARLLLGASLAHGQEVAPDPPDDRGKGDRATSSTRSPISGSTRDLDNVILSPHVSGFLPSYDDRCAELFAENLRRYLAGAPLLNLVDRARGY
jgi:hypothetical protein